MKAVIKVEHSRYDHKNGMEIAYDTIDLGTIWVEIRPEAGLKYGESGWFPPKTYKLVVGDKGGLSLK